VVLGNGGERATFNFLSKGSFDLVGRGGSGGGGKAASGLGDREEHNICWDSMSVQGKILPCFFELTQLKH
jgi:hypothetical protein